MTFAGRARPGRPRVFAVDGDVVQIEHDGRIEDAPFDDPRLRGVRVRRVPSPPGPLVAKIATISDIHIGEPGFGMLPRVVPPQADRKSVV